MSIKLEKARSKNIQSNYNQLEIERLKTCLTYNHYLQYLRKSVNNKQTNKSSKNTQSLHKQQRNRFHIVSKQIMSKVFGKSQKQQKFSEIKVSHQIAQQIINDQILKISAKMDQNLQKGLKILHIDLNKNQDNRKKEQVLIFDCQCANVREEKQFQNQGVSLNLLNHKLSNQIKLLALKKQFYDQKSIYLDHRNQQSLNLHSNIKFRNKLKKQFKKGDSDYRFITNIQQIQRQKENIHHRTIQHGLQKQLNAKTMHSTQNFMTPHPNQFEIDKIFSNYYKKLQKYGKFDAFMTQKRKQGIFVNEIIKLKRKYNTIEVLPSIWQKRELKEQKRSEQQIKVQNQQKLSNKDLKKKCKQSFQYLSDLQLQKL